MRRRYGRAKARRQRAQTYYTGTGFGVGEAPWENVKGSAAYGKGGRFVAYEDWLRQVDAVLWKAHHELTNDYGDRAASLITWWADGASPETAADRLHRGPSRKFGRAS